MLRDHLASPKVEEWLTQALQAAERANSRTTKEQDEVGRLEAEVKVQEARVDKETESLAFIGYSEPLARKLKTEEAKLLDLRQALTRAAGSSRPAPAQTPVVTAAHLMAALRSIGQLAARKPAEARQRRAAIVESIVLKPEAGGNKATLHLRNETAALASGRGVDWGSCGGLQEVWESAAPGPLSLFLPCLRGAMF